MKTVFSIANVSPQYVFSWEQGLPGLLVLPGLPPGVQAAIVYSIETMEVQSIKLQTPVGIKYVSFDVLDYKHRRTFAKLKGTNGTAVYVPVEPGRFFLDRRGGVGFFHPNVCVTVDMK